MLESVPTLAPRLCFERGDIVFRLNDPSDFLYEITLGSVRLVGKRANGTPGEVAVLGPGSLLGLDALVGDPRRAHAVVIDDTVELRPISPADLDGDWLRRALLDRLRSAERRVLDGDLRKSPRSAR